MTSVVCLLRIKGVEKTLLYRIPAKQYGAILQAGAVVRAVYVSVSSFGQWSVIHSQRVAGVKSVSEKMFSRGSFVHTS